MAPPLGRDRDAAALVARHVPDRRGGGRLIELLPTKATFAPDEPVEIEVRGADSAVEVTLVHLDRLVDRASAEGGIARFPPQPEGGYGAEVGGARTALDVLADPLARARYGFVSQFAAGRNPAAFGDTVRRLHLNAIQFYDWMYRHADLIPPQDDFDDPLGRELSLTSVRGLVDTARAAGSLPLGYAAVYAVGRDEWPAWVDAGLYRPDGTPWTLGDDFLWIVDPTNERWLEHLAAELDRARRDVGFAGFHLDQYGAPKRALRNDGTDLALATAFPALIERLSARLPETRLIFNNVNDFPTWKTARAPQDAVYIEVWPPHDRLHHLVQLVDKARLLAPEKAVILAAYLSTFGREDAAAATAAQSILLATAFSLGASCLLHGEEGAVLTEAYYPRHHQMGADAAEKARAYYDFAVRYGDLLFDPAAVDVTNTELGGVNEELVVSAPVPVSGDCEAGVLWARARRCSSGVLVSLVDLSDQTDDRWDAGKRPGRPLSGVRLSAARVRRGEPGFFGAAPDAPALTSLSPRGEGRYDVVDLPPIRTWALVLVRERASG